MKHSSFFDASNCLLWPKTWLTRMTRRIWGRPAIGHQLYFKYSVNTLCRVPDPRCFGVASSARRYPVLKQVTTASSPQQVWERLSRNEPMFILDVRNRDEFERWRVEGPHPVPALNIPYFELLDLEGEQEDVVEAVIRGARAQLMPQLPSDRLILAVCAEGNTSNYVAEGLRRDRKSTRLNSSHQKISYAVF